MLLCYTEKNNGQIVPICNKGYLLQGKRLEEKALDKVEYKIKADEIKALINMGAYQEAVEIADEIDWRRVKSSMMLCTISDLYKINRRYEDSRNILLLAYEKNPGSRTIVYSLCELSIKTGDLVMALEYCKEYAQLAPNDIGKHILTYKMYRAQGVSLEEQIAILEELKTYDYREKWAYELAYLYHRVGLATKCIQECDEMFVWFRVGKYVIQALELKMLHAPLTAEQQEAYDHRFDEQLKEQEAEEGENASAAQENGEESGEQEEEGSKENIDLLNAPTTRIPSEEIEIQVQMMENSPYDTINLQQQVADGLKEYFANEEGSELDKYRFSSATEEDLEREAREQNVASDELPKKYENALSMESDGQISLVVPEQSVVEKQITGQMSIDDILTEWERMKQESAKKSEDSVRQLVLQQTGSLFTEFDEAIKDGLLERIEKGEAVEGIIEPEDEVEELAELSEDENQEDGYEAFGESMEEDTDEEAEEDTEEADAEVEETEAEEVAEDEVEETEESEEAFNEEVDEADIETEEETESEEIIEKTVEAEEIEIEIEEDEEAEEIEVSVEADEDEEAEIEEAEEAAEEESEEEESEEAESEESEETEVEEQVEEVRELTADEKELFRGFIDHPKAQKMLTKALDAISLAPYTGNVLIVGEDAKNCLRLCKCMIKDMQTGDANFSGKVAKVSGAAFNNRDVEATLESLAGGALIIQKAADMTAETIDRMYKALQQEKYGILILIYDTRIAMHQFMKDNPRLASCFTSRMEIRTLSDKDLAKYGQDYARSLEYSIDEMGILELHTSIAERQTSDHAVTKAEVREIVDQAIKRANKVSLAHFFDIIFAKRYDAEDMIILRDKDFRDLK